MNTETLQLSKENFWNEIVSNYPGEAARFLLWIDQYKNKVGWDHLFNSNSDYQDYKGKNAPAPKFHDLPAAMQMGIFIQYCLEQPHRYEFIEGMPTTMDALIDQVRKFFRNEEKMYSGIQFLESNY